MVEAYTHVVWDKFNTEGAKGPDHCSCGLTSKGSCLVEIRGG